MTMDVSANPVPGISLRVPTYPEFSIEEYAARNERCQQILRGKGFDALFVTMYENVEWLTGFGSESWKTYEKAWWAVVPAAGQPVLTVDGIHEGNVEGACVYEDVRFWGIDRKSPVDRLVGIFQDLELQDKRVAMEYGQGTRLFMAAADWDEIRERLPNVQWLDGHDVLMEMRAVKSPAEIERIKKANKITCYAYESAFNSFQKGMTERDLVNLVKRFMLEQGADATIPGVGGYLALSADRINQITPRTVAYREIQDGDLVHIDGGATYRGYYSDIYRVGIVNATPHPFVEKCAETVACAIDHVIDAVRPGVLSSELCAIAWDVIQRNGLGNKVRSMTDTVSSGASTASECSLGHIGHGIGFSIHEAPFITPSDNTPWRAGMVAAIEIMLGDPTLGWVEFEDNVVATEDGCERITPLPKRLFRL
jgi:Xaa-Pro aminopeptidase